MMIWDDDGDYYDDDDGDGDNDHDEDEDGEEWWRGIW